MAVPTKREVLEVLQPGELLHAGIGELAVVGEAQGLEARELRDVRHPLVVELRGDDVERLQRRDVAEVLEEGRVIRIVLAMVVRTRTGHGEIDELEALAVLGLFDFAFGGFDDADDRFDMRVEGEGAGREREGGEEDKVRFHGVWSHEWFENLFV